MAALVKCSTRTREEPRLLVNQFRYHDTDTGLIHKNIKERARIDERVDIKTGSRPLRIIHSINK